MSDQFARRSCPLRSPTADGTARTIKFDLPSCIEDTFAEIDSDIVMDLPNADEDYAALSDRMDKLKTQYPVIDKVNEDSGEIRMTAEEHRAYMDYLNLARQMEDMERQHIYFRGHTDAVVYLKKIKAI
ncbi:MAG: DUF6664 family protein [Oscillospiraceae bacterium]